MPDLLIELFSEEIPARMQPRAAADLKRLVTDGLVEAGLTYAHAAAFATPRRLTLALEGLTDRSPDLREERRGPREDAPEKAVEGFLRGAGLTRDDLEIREEKKGRFYFATIEKPGRPAPEIVAEVLERTVRDFPWPKSMRWGTGSLRWVRPLHSILCILTGDEGAEVVPLEIDGIAAGDTTCGHRFMAPEPFSVTSFEDYAAKLKRAFIMLDPEERAEHIHHEAEQLAFAAGMDLVADEGLLREVAGLVEWPVPLMGEIGAEFMELPPEVLQTSMKEHQKFFSLRNPSTGRIERFVTVANRETPDDGATVLAGNRKVLTARLSDAKFFWENDLRVAKAGMEPWLAQLENVTFHAKLGSQAERITRIAALARELAPSVGADADRAEQAARVAKADLESEMVGEFPELQGLMGRYYSDAAGLPSEVAAACEDHYAPLGPSDAVPEAPVSVAVALADKLDTLAGFWAIDEKPTGSKDPYALRRAALGVIRILVDSGTRLPLENVLSLGIIRSSSSAANILAAIISETEAKEILATAKEKGLEEAGESLAQKIRETNSDLDNRTDEIVDNIVNGLEDRRVDLLSFLHDRLKVHLREEGIRHDVIDACLAMEGADDLALLVRRAEALGDFLKTEDGENLLQGFKRASNILTQAETADGVEYSFGADVKFADDPAEKALFAALDAERPAIDKAMKAEDFAGAMSALARLRAPIDAFFEAVQVNADSPVLRRNRLNLLSRIRTLCLDVADLRRIEG